MVERGRKQTKLRGELYSGRQARESQEQTKQRGPDKGSQREGQSDQQLQYDIEQRLSHTPGIEADAIEVSVNHGDVVLLGSVKHDDSRQQAETIAKSVDRVKSVRNDINVWSI